MATPLADLTSHDTYVNGVPHDTFAFLRAHDAVHWTEESDGGRGFWSLTKHEDVVFAGRHSEIFSSRQGTRLEDTDEEETEARRTMMEIAPHELIGVYFRSVGTTFAGGRTLEAYRCPRRSPVLVPRASLRLSRIYAAASAITSSTSRP